MGIEVGGTTVPDTTASVKAAAADHLAAKTLYSGYGGYGYGGYGGYGYGGYGKRSAEAWVPDNLAQFPIGGGLCTAVGALAATSGAVVPCFTPEFQAVALAHQQKGKREAEAEPWYGWRGYSGAPIAGGALVIGQNSVTPDYTPEQKGAAWGLNWGLVKGRQTLRPMPTMAIVDTDWDTDLAMEATAMVVLVMATARGLLTLKPMPTTAMAATDWDTGSAMEVMAMAVLDMATARGLLTLKPMPTMVMARGLLMPSPTMAMVEPTPATAMAVTVLVLAMATASKGQSCSRELQPLKLTLEEQIDPSKNQEIILITVINWRMNKIVQFQAKKRKIKLDSQ